VVYIGSVDKTWMYLGEVFDTDELHHAFHLLFEHCIDILVF
jgi:hypothetical protein